jgi:hypothetical protein
VTFPPIFIFSKSVLSPATLRSLLKKTMASQQVSQFKQIYAVKIVGAAHDDKEALAFDVQGTRTRWRSVRTPDDFHALSHHFQSMSKIPSLPKQQNITPSTLGKWLTSVFWLFKGRRGGSASATASSGDRSLSEFLKFLHPSQSDTYPKGMIASSSDTDSLGRTTATSDSISSDLCSLGREAAADALGPTSAVDDIFGFVTSSLDGSEDSVFFQEDRNETGSSTATAGSSRRSTPTSRRSARPLSKSSR